MTTHHTGEKKPADAGDVEALTQALKVLEACPRFKLKLALGKLDYLLRTMDGDLVPSRETERDIVRHGIFATLTWLSEVDANLFPGDYQQSWIRTIATHHFDSRKAQSDSSS